MRQSHTQRDPSPGTGQEDPAPLITLPLDLTDHAGRKRQGRAVLLPKCPPERSSEHLSEGEDFRICVLSEPPEGPVSPCEGMVVSAPSHRLGTTTAAAREATATRGTGKRSGLALSPKDVELLRQGRLFSATPLQLTAEDVFAGGKAHLDLLARDLLASIAETEYLGPIAIALNAPNAAKPATQERLEELKRLVRAFSGTKLSDEASEAKGALARLSQLASCADRERFLTCAEKVYLSRQALMEDIYTLRAFQQSPDRASELSAMRRFLWKAVVPADDADLALDRSLAMEQLTFAALAAEPQRLAPAKVMLETFRRKYISRYREHHTEYWAEMARLRARLLEAEPRVEALRRLSTLTELGPPMGVGALVAYEALVGQTRGCALISGVEEVVGTDGICFACGISMDQPAAAQRVDEVLQRIERACQRQMARLSSSAVRQVLRRSNDARVEQFLKVVQASQLSSLPDILDDELAGYLRRFLVESRIQEALEPIFNQLERGASPKVDEARRAMREVSQVLQRAFQATQRALPPGDVTETDGSRRRKRNR